MVWTPPEVRALGGLSHSEVYKKLKLMNWDTDATLKQVILCTVTWCSV